ncbi:MAG: hypothetical protein COB69_07800 [Phycisphaera sp.]|nr:MAG: hypothetical protein COB69_07800 [Phycisphaera sp.]
MLLIIAYIAGLVAVILLVGTAATEPSVLGRLKMFSNPCMTMWLAYFVLTPSGMYSMIFIMYIPFIPVFILFIRHRRFTKTHTNDKLCADCGYLLEKHPADTHPDDNPSPVCPECGGRFWFYMPAKHWGDLHATSNMPRLWVSRRQLLFMFVLSAAIITSGIVLARSLQRSFLGWQIGSVDIGWVPPFATWIAAVSATFLVNQAIRRRADEARLTAKAPPS